MENIIKFKYHILLATTFTLIILYLIYISPSFLNILSYFGPLLVSTALFLVAVVVFGLTSPPSAQTSGEKAGDGILDYVAGQPEPLVQPDLAEGTSSNTKSEM